MSRAALEGPAALESGIAVERLTWSAPAERSGDGAWDFISTLESKAVSLPINRDCHRTPNHFAT
jgi:hypothetical protein